MQNCLWFCWKLLVWAQFGLQELWCHQFVIHSFEDSWRSKILINTHGAVNELCSLIWPGFSRALGGLLIEFLKEVFCISVRLSFLYIKALYCDVGVVKRGRCCKCLSTDMNADLESSLSQGWDQAGPFEIFTSHLESWAGGSRDGWAPGKVSGQLVRLYPKVWGKRKF